MNSALLHNGNVITAREYISEAHGNRLYCLDNSCKVPVIHVPENKNRAAYFKTTGKNDSIHVRGCGFAKPLTFVESVQKVGEYQESLLDKGISETIVKVNLNKIDPDYVSKSIDRDNKQNKKQDPNEVKLKQDNAPPASIGSLKSVVKLMTSYEPDILSSILVNIKGKKIPISSLIVNQETAHYLLWEERVIPYVSYFVYGQVESVLRLEKVIYINYKTSNNVTFSLVIFDKYFKFFTYTRQELEGKTILAWGILRKNTYQNNNKTEMVIKSDDYISILP